MRASFVAAAVAATTASARGPRPSSHASQHPKFWNDKQAQTRESGEPLPSFYDRDRARAARPNASYSELDSKMCTRPSGNPSHPKLWNDKFYTMSHDKGSKKSSTQTTHKLTDHRTNMMPTVTAPPMSSPVEPTGVTSAKGPHRSGKSNHSKKPWDSEHCTMSNEYTPKGSGHAHSHTQGFRSKTAIPTDPTESGLFAVPSGTASAWGFDHSVMPTHLEHWDDKFRK